MEHYFTSKLMQVHTDLCHTKSGLHSTFLGSHQYMCWMHLVAHKLSLTCSAARGLTPVRCAAGRSEPALRANSCRSRRQQTGPGSARASRSRSARHPAEEDRRACAGRVVWPSGLSGWPRRLSRGYPLPPAGSTGRWCHAHRHSARGDTLPSQAGPSRCAGKGPGPRTPG
jgi:hypothetical protein